MVESLGSWICNRSSQNSSVLVAVVGVSGCYVMRLERVGG